MNTNGDTIGHPVLSPERVMEHTLTIAATDRAAATPLPGPLANAFGPGTIEVCGVKVRKFMAADWEIFQMIKSPVLDMVLEWEKPEGARDAITSSNTQEWEMVYQFTHSCAEVYALVEKDREAFHKLCVEQVGLNEAFADKLSPIIAAVMEQFKRHVETRVKFMAEAKEQGEITFFRDTKASPTTG